MPHGGTRIYCPKCCSFEICKAVPVTQLGVESGQRWFREEFPDISWFRRGRECQECGNSFLTAEVDESLIEELVESRGKVAKKQGKQVSRVRRRSTWLARDEIISLELAEEFVKASAWWLKHPSGPIRAPGHAKNIYKSPSHGWTLDFGANSFLVGKAIEWCRLQINDYLDMASDGDVVYKSELVSDLKFTISGAVANAEGIEYAGNYPLSENDMVFGTNSIDVNDGANYLIKKAQLDDLFFDDLQAWESEANVDVEEREMDDAGMPEMSADIVNFPIGKSSASANELRGLRRMTDMQLIGAILNVNREALGLDDYADPSEYVSIFEDDRYPELVLVNVDCPTTGTKGLFTVDSDSLELLRLLPEPLVRDDDDEDE